MKSFSLFWRYHFMRWQLLIPVIFVFISCTPDSVDDIGQHSIEVKVFHHANPVPFIDVWVMEGAEDFPGDDLESYHFRETADNLGVVRINGLLAGFHWIYGLGVENGDTIKGNTGIYVDPLDTDGMHNYILQVSEKH